MTPDLTRVGEFYHNYIRLVEQEDLNKAFLKYSASFLDFFKALPDNKLDFRYAHGKWTIREVLQHIIDAERVFSYRALRFARKDATPLPGFDENLFAETSKASHRSWDDLLEEFSVVRKSSALLFQSFDEEQLNASGISSGSSNYVLALGYIIIGHSLHHQNIIRERYL